MVVGEGSASGTPDRCELTIGLNVLADTPAVALEEVARLADAVTQVLRDREIPAAAGVAASMQSVTVEPGSHRVSVRVIVTYAIDDEA